MQDHRTPDVFDMIADVVRAREATWRLQAACRNSSTEVFYPSQTGPGSSHPAKAICRRCEVQAECEAEWASMPGPQRNHGVWFGTVERERRKIRSAQLAEQREHEQQVKMLPLTCSKTLTYGTLPDVGTAAFGSGGEWVRTPHRFEVQAAAQETSEDERLVHTGGPGPGG